MISSPHLATTLLYDVSRRWSQYLNRCVAASTSEVEEAPGASVPCSVEPILVELERGRYIVPIHPVALAYLVEGRRRRLRWRQWQWRRRIKKQNLVPMVAASGGSTRVRLRYDAHLPSLSLWDGEKSRSILTGVVLLTLCSHVLCKNLHMCGVCWEDHPREDGTRFLPIPKGQGGQVRVIAHPNSCGFTHVYHHRQRLFRYAAALSPVGRLPAMRLASEPGRMATM